MLDEISKKYNIMLEDIKKTHFYKSLFYKVELCANFAYCFNLEYKNDVMEMALDKIASNFDLIKTTTRQKILFFDSFGLEFRGLVNQYIDGMIEKSLEFEYATFKNNDIGILKDKLTKNNIIIHYIDKTIIGISELSQLLNNFSELILYIRPNDVIPLVCVRNFNGTKFLINLTDHAFWLGVKHIDYYIEFREYGASISYFYRGIAKEKLVMLPYYPYEIKTEFKGYPCAEMNKNNTIFSGGSTYKTIDDSLLYYKIIDTILCENPDKYFWFAGSGEMKYLIKLQEKYRGRVYITKERNDLVQILNHSRIYISTYPMIGGLMSQYAVLANIPALTLLYDECSSGVLLSQGEKAFEFNAFEDLISESNKLLNDDKYYKIRLNDWCKNVISKTQFNNNLYTLITKGTTEFDVDIKRKFDTSRFKKTYIDRANKVQVQHMLVNRRFVFFKKFWYYYFELFCKKVFKRKSKRK